MAILQIPITKAGRSIEVETTSIPDEMYTLALAEGLKILLNAKMSKITVAKLEGEALEAARSAAYDKAQENFTALMAGKLSKGRKTTAKAGISREVQTEALRLAKAIVKDEIRAAGMRPSMVAASEITAYAKTVLENDTSLYETAKANLAARSDIKPKVTLSFKEDPKLVAKAEKAAEEKKAAKKGTISAKQAGMVKPRAKPGRESHPTAH